MTRARPRGVIAGMPTLIDTKADMDWLRDVHIPRLPKKYKSAVIHGNEDWPTKIEVYEKRSPNVTDVPVVYVDTGDRDKHDAGHGYVRENGRSRTTRTRRAPARKRTRR